MWLTTTMLRNKVPTYFLSFLDEDTSRFQELILQATIHIRSKTGIPLPDSESVSPFWYIDTVAQLVHIFALIQSGAISSEEQTTLIMKRWDLIDERLLQFRLNTPSSGKSAKAGVFPTESCEGLL